MVEFGIIKFNALDVVLTLVGRALYERFFGAIAPRTTVRAVTAPVNERSVAFHRALGFDVERVDEDYDGRGEARVLLVRHLGA